MEQCDLTVPETDAPNTFWRVTSLKLTWPDGISIGLIGTNGERKSHGYSGDVATTLIKQLNTANLSVKSLHRRILERLAADGVFAGTISGVPD